MAENVYNVVKALLKSNTRPGYAGWKEPRCVEVCPTRALVFGDLSDPDSEVAKQWAANAVEELHAEYGLQPSVGFLRLPKRFVTGEVVLADKAELAGLERFVQACVCVESDAPRSTDIGKCAW